MLTPQTLRIKLTLPVVFLFCLCALANSGELDPIWESSAGNHGKELIHSFSDDGKLAFFNHTGSKKIIVRDTTTWKETKQIPVNDKEMKRAVDAQNVIGKDGKLGAKASLVYIGGVAKSSRIIFYDPATNAALATVDAHPVYMTPVLAFSPDGRLLASGSVDGVILWDARNYRRIRFIKHQQSYRPSGMVFTPDNKTIAVNSNSQVVFWDVATGRYKFALGGHIAQVWNIAISPDGKQIASVGNDPQLLFWNPQTGINIGRIPLDTAHLVAPVCFSPEGKMLAVGDKKTVRIFDPQSKKLVLELRGHTSNVQSMAFRPDGKQLATGSGGVRWINDSPHADRGEFIIWDVASGEALHTNRSHKLGVHSIAFSPDGKTLITGGGANGAGMIVNVTNKEHDQAIGMWASDSGKLIKWIAGAKGHAATALAYSPDGKMIAHNAVDGGQIQLLDAKSGKEIRKLQLKNPAVAFAFSKDGKRIASVGHAGGLDTGKGYIQVLDPNSGKTIAHRIAHTQGINCVVFGADGRTLLTGGSDSAIWKWNLTED